MSYEPIAIDAELADFLRRRSTTVLSTVNDSGVPDVAYGLACLVDPDGRRVRAVFDRRLSLPLLSLIGAGSDRVALVCAEPITYRSVQVKGVQARVLPLPAGERAEVAELVSRLRESYAGVMDPAFAAALLDHNPDELVCVSFVPVALFEQTPGPKAGQPLARSA